MNSKQSKQKLLLINPKKKQEIIPYAQLQNIEYKLKYKNTPIYTIPKYQPKTEIYEPKIKIIPIKIKQDTNILVTKQLKKTVSLVNLEQNGMKLNNCDFLDELDEKIKNAMSYGRILRQKLVKESNSDDD